MRRELAIGVLLALALTTGGCVQAVTGDSVTFEASPATVADGALAEQGYELGERDEVQVDRTVEVPGLGERDVLITNHVRVYGPAGEGDAEETAPGALIVVSTPQAKVAGQGTNPLGRVPLKELITRLASESDGIEDAEQVGTRDLETLDTTTTVEKYSTTGQADGESVETFVYVTRVPHGDDYVIAIGVLPAESEDRESTLYDLMRNLEHDGA